MIELRQLTRTFGNLMAVDHVTFTVPSGQVCGYLGPNGAGKTTTIKMLTGLIRPAGGTAVIEGFDILKEPIEVKKRIGYVPESGALYEKLTPMEYLQLIGRLYHIEEAHLKHRIDEFLQLFQLEGKENQRMDAFSKGMKQKIVIVSALLHNPDVMFFDEPLNGLDAGSALLVKELIRKLADQGKTIFYSSHILEVVEKICDRVVILDHGRIVADGSIQDLRRMTAESSLEDIFSQVTHSEDMEIGRASCRERV